MSYICDFCGGKKSYKAMMCLKCRGIQSRKNRKHGTVNMYLNFGCRCKKCKTAWAAERRVQRAKARA